MEKADISSRKILIILGIVIAVLIGLGAFIVINDNKPKSNGNKPNTPIDEVKVETPVDKENTKEKVDIVNLESNARPIAVMINNHLEARKLQSGLQDAYLVYEMQVEYGLTRLMAVYKDKNTERIGSVRSSRHTFLDYVMENDAIYTHFGWSYVAEAQIPQLGINNINGLSDAGFWRDQNLINAGYAYEHTVFTNMAKIKEVARNKGYSMVSSKKTLLNYSVSDVDLSTNEKKVKADNITLAFSPYTQTSFSYDEDNKVYKRSVNREIIVDYVTKKQITFKNIIAIKVNNWTMSGTSLQDFSNVGTGDGYYITNGYSIPIKWNKKDRASQTVYTDLFGNEIEVSDGNTFIGLIPLNNSFTIN